MTEEMKAAFREGLAETLRLECKRRAAFWEVAEQKPLIGGSVNLRYTDGDRTVECAFPVDPHDIQLLIDSYDRICGQHIGRLNKELEELWPKK